MKQYQLSNVDVEQNRGESKAGGKSVNKKQILLDELKTSDTCVNFCVLENKI